MFWKSFYGDDIQPEIQVAPGLFKVLYIIRYKKIDHILVQYPYNPNTTKSYSYKNYIQNTQHMVQLPYPIYRHGKACLSKQPPWRAAGDPRLARGRSRVRAPGAAGELRALFFSTLPSFLLREIFFFRTFPTKPTGRLGLKHTTGWVYYNPNTTKSYKHCLRNMQHVVLRNRPTLSIGTERLACLNNPHGVQLGTLA